MSMARFQRPNASAFCGACRYPNPIVGGPGYRQETESAGVGAQCRAKEGRLARQLKRSFTRRENLDLWRIFCLHSDAAKYTQDPVSLPRLSIQSASGSLISHTCVTYVIISAYLSVVQVCNFNLID